MAIKPKCNMCGIELKEYGAILLSPPDSNDSVKKYHICAQCFERITSEFKNK